MHVSRRYHPNKGSVLPESESDVQQAVLSRFSQCIETWFFSAVPRIVDNDQRIVEEQLSASA